MKILALSYLFPNRIKSNHGIFVLNRLKALSKYVDIKVINPISWFPGQSMFEPYKHRADIPAQDRIGGLEVYHPRFFSVPKFLKGREGEQYLKAIRPVIHEIYKNFDFDIIDMHWTFPDLPAGIAVGKQYKKKTIVTLRGMEAFHEQDTDQRQTIVAKGLREVNAVIALSEELKNRGDQLSKVPDKSTVIRNGVDTDQFYFIPKSQSRQHIGMGEDELSILSVGSLIYRKGFDLLIKCIAKMKKEGLFKDIHLYIIGSEGAEGDYRNELGRLIEQFDVKNNITFVGQVANDDLKYWYNASDLFCLASRGEGSPNVLGEALACGCPSVTTDVGSAREIIEAKPGLGSCVTADSEQELIVGLKSILPIPFDRQSNAERFGRYNWDWCARQVLPIYEHLVAGKSSNRVSSCSESTAY